MKALLFLPALLATELALADHLFTADTSEFEHEVNQLRTHQGQSDVFVIHREELPEDADVATALVECFGAEAGDEVVEVRAGKGFEEMASRRWRLVPFAPRDPVCSGDDYRGGRLPAVKRLCARGPDNALWTCPAAAATTVRPPSSAAC